MRRWIAAAAGVALIASGALAAPAAATAAGPGQALIATPTTTFYPYPDGEQDEVTVEVIVPSPQNMPGLELRAYHGTTEEWSTPLAHTFSQWVTWNGQNAGGHPVYGAITFRVYEVNHGLQALIGSSSTVTASTKKVTAHSWSKTVQAALATDLMCDPLFGGGGVTCHFGRPIKYVNGHFMNGISYKNDDSNVADESGFQFNGITLPSKVVHSLRPIRESVSANVIFSGHAHTAAYLYACGTTSSHDDMFCPAESVPATFTKTATKTSGTAVDVWNDPDHPSNTHAEAVWAVSLRGAVTVTIWTYTVHVTYYALG